MESDRKFAIQVILGLIVFFIGAMVVNYFLGEVTVGFYWGLPIGILFGSATCLYLSETWDPVHLAPKDPNASPPGKWVYWFVPLGVIFGNIITRFFSPLVSDLVGGCFFGWLLVVFAYMAFQAWRHRPGS